MTNISIRNVNKIYTRGNTRAVTDLNLEIPASEFLCLLGPSGCGKSTTLRMIAGLENLSSGEISIGDKVVDANAEGIFVPPEKRQLGMVFQNYALWPHMTIEENIEFGLRIKKVPANERKTIIDTVVKKLGIEKYRQRYPSEVSGGQQQRVALARMIAVSPKVILLDEPLSNLDAKLRLDMRTELKRIHAELGSTFVFVTHDQWEAMTLATKIAVMNEGRLQQIGTPEDIYDRPANRFVAEFVGTLPINIIEMGSLDNSIFKNWLSEAVELLCLGDQSIHSIGVRPETIDILPSTASSANGNPQCSAQIIDLVPTGGNWIIELDIAGTRLFALKAQIGDLKPEQLIQLSVSKNDLHAFDAAGDRLTQISSN
ncbi:ABC transporter ATP-binding protein [Pseudovibrio sp. Tun.PSC04-5.I4]|uniref:ABC transporter ATP-binding protein n=1 Tax=Pseudovibrio sp. Tun.PSC04-5.I4 TaxID=1798213 RepID=UPI00088BEE72|nr:ABC transporter ATP-binding protein [Pseudovibrio sp. Tun.PSC04-5.I4]SDR16613.1 carbohydrate ABC transporter ATP-binding protein, CUT1 family [Pseudovibrio sp. Tun.PSC04-5.I4]